MKILSERNTRIQTITRSNVKVPHHLGPVKGSSPDIIPLMYLLVLINRSNSTPYAFGNNVIDKVYQVLVFYGINKTSFEKPTKYRTKVYSKVRMPF